MVFRENQERGVFQVLHTHGAFVLFCEGPVVALLAATAWESIYVVQLFRTLFGWLSNGVRNTMLASHS